MHGFVDKQNSPQQPKSTNSVKSRWGASNQNREVNSTLYLQRTIGNHATQKLLQKKSLSCEEDTFTRASLASRHDANEIPIQTGPIQAKLQVGHPDDKYEQEADHMADRVMSLTPNIPTLQTKCHDCEKEGILQTKPARMKSKSTQVTTPAFTSKLNHSKGNGYPLSAATNHFMSRAFGHDFSNVKIHTDTRAAQMNKSIYARAFTHCSDIYFNQGEYSPGSFRGKKLLAHELTHVIQQKQVNSIQRKTHECQNNPLNGKRLGLPCGISDSILPGPSEEIFFNINSSALGRQEKLQISHFVRAWIDSGGNTRIGINGFASCEGTENFNWRLSCDRANSLAHEIISQGVDAKFVSRFANGETNQFSETDLSANRKSIISLGSSPKPTPAPTPTPVVSENVLIWLNAFIPGTVPGGTKTISKGTFSGKTCIEAPLFGCALSDNRSFSKSRQAKTRMRLFILVDLKTLTFKFGGFSDFTHHVDLKNGALLCKKRSKGNYRVDGKVMSMNPNALGMKFIASGSNPCVPVAPAIDFMGVIGIDRKARRIKVQTLVDGFPAYEMYISSTKTGATSTIFTSPPECNDRRNVMCLFGNPRFPRKGDINF